MEAAMPDEREALAPATANEWWNSLSDTHRAALQAGRLNMMEEAFTAGRKAAIRAPGFAEARETAARIQQRVAAGEVDLRDVAVLCGETWDQDLLAGILSLAALPNPGGEDA
jgi:hypothetical protein